MIVSQEGDTLIMIMLTSDLMEFVQIKFDLNGRYRESVYGHHYIFTIYCLPSSTHIVSSSFQATQAENLVFIKHD